MTAKVNTTKGTIPVKLVIVIVMADKTICMTLMGSVIVRLDMMGRNAMAVQMNTIKLAVCVKYVDVNPMEQKIIIVMPPVNAQVVRLDMLVKNVMFVQ